MRTLDDKIIELNSISNFKCQLKNLPENIFEYESKNSIVNLRKYPYC